MADLLFFKSQVLSYFNDPTQMIYSDESIALALRFTLQEYSASLPYLEEFVCELVNSGNEVEIPQSTAAEGVRKVYYPWDDTKSYAEQAPNQIVRWNIEILAESLVLFLQTNTGTPLQAGRQLRLLLEKQHTIAGLDGAAATTVPQAHLHLLLQGTLGNLLLHTASNRGDILDKNLCERLAQTRLAAFRRMLEVISNQFDRSQAIVMWQNKNSVPSIY